MDKDIQKIVEATKKGGEKLLKYFNTRLEVTEKSTPADFVTKADLESETAVIKSLETNFPEYNIISEEKGEINKGSEYTFIIDPLDGSNNFILGIDNFSIAIALLKKDEVIAGIVYLPVTNRLYWAKRGSGAYCGDTRLAVNQVDDIKKIKIAYIGNYQDYDSHLVEILREMNQNRVKKVRVMNNWCPNFDFCLLAEGKLEVVINDGCDFYDYVAGTLIAKEAGAKVTDFSGDELKDYKNNVFLAINGTEVHDKIFKIL